jgi:hypothetical protein
MENYRYQLKLLQEKLFWLNREVSSLLDEFKEYQSFFKDSTPSEAEDKFYNTKLDQLLEWSDWEETTESRYNVEHRSLKTRMKENRDERNKLITKIREIKNQIKDLQRKK